MKLSIRLMVTVDVEDLADERGLEDAKRLVTNALEANVDEVYDMLFQEVTEVDGIPVGLVSVTVDGREIEVQQ